MPIEPQRQPDWPVDPGNKLLTERPAQVLTALIETPATGQRLAVTIRTETTTLTVQLSAADAKAWAAQISSGASLMSTAGLIVAPNGGVIR